MPDDDPNIRRMKSHPHRTWRDADLICEENMIPSYYTEKNEKSKHYSNGWVPGIATKISWCPSLYYTEKNEKSKHYSNGWVPPWDRDIHKICWRPSLNYTIMDICIKCFSIVWSEGMRKFPFLQFLIDPSLTKKAKSFLQLWLISQDRCLQYRGRVWGDWCLLQVLPAPPPVGPLLHHGEQQTT